MKPSLLFSLVTFAPVLVALLLPAVFLLPTGVLIILLAVLDPTLPLSGALSYNLWAVAPLLAASLLYLAGIGLHRLNRRAPSPWITWVPAWVLFTAGLFLALWLAITVLTSIGASDQAPADFLRWTGLMAAVLTLLAQPLALLWLYAASRAARHLRLQRTSGSAPHWIGLVDTRTG
jgi:hypothetical protein